MLRRQGDAPSDIGGGDDYDDDDDDDEDDDDDNNNNNNNNNTENGHVGHCTHTSESTNAELQWSQRRN
jgi:hypothetical protein